MIIGIGGPSNSGKSRLADRLMKELSHPKSIVLCQDDYVFPEVELPRIRDHVDWEHPGTVDFRLYESGLVNAASRNDIVIAEGFLLYFDPRINALFDKMIFIEITRNTFFRRKAGDIRWGREPDWYLNHIWESYNRFGRPPAGFDILFLNGEEDIPMKKVLSFLNI